MSLEEANGAGWVLVRVLTPFLLNGEVESVVQHSPNIGWKMFSPWGPRRVGEDALYRHHPQQTARRDVFATRNW